MRFFAYVRHITAILGFAQTTMFVHSCVSAVRVAFCGPLLYTRAVAPRCDPGVDSSRSAGGDLNTLS